LTEYAGQEGFQSRSAVLHKAVRLLRASGLGGAYERAWDEWADTNDGKTWEATVGDGLSG